jgi:regulator of PEP synthase PpsR (kinase-PPPase family)
VTRRSIEEIAATIMNHLASRRVALDEDALS